MNLITRPRLQHRFHAFTLVELLVVIAIIGVLLGMSIPAMQNMRELSRRSNCEQNLVRISLALSAYATRNGHYPTGTLADSGPIQSEPKGYHHNWIAALLPMLDAANVAKAIDDSASVYDSANDQVRSLRIPTLLCPTASDIAQNSTCYAGVHASTETPIDEDNDGVFRLNLPVSDSDITDGLGYTLFVGEMLSAFNEDLGWMSGTRSSLRNTGHKINAERQRIRGVEGFKSTVAPTYVGGLASDHPGGAYLLMGSGEFRFRSASMDQKVMQQLASRADGSIPLEWVSDAPLDRTVEAAPAAKAAEAGGAADDDKSDAEDDGGTDDASADAPDDANADGDAD